MHISALNPLECRLTDFYSIESIVILVCFNNIKDKMQLFSALVNNIFTDAVNRLACVEPGTFLLTAVLYVFHKKCKHARRM